MKATGIVRRIDDLGRVVVPKEIRRTLRIREGAPLQKTLLEIINTYGEKEKEFHYERLFIDGILELARRLGVERKIMNKKSKKDISKRACVLFCNRIYSSLSSPLFT